MRSIVIAEAGLKAQDMIIPLYTPSDRIQPKSEHFICNLGRTSCIYNETQPKCLHYCLLQQFKLIQTDQQCKLITSVLNRIWIWFNYLSLRKGKWTWIYSDFNHTAKFTFSKETTHFLDRKTHCSVSIESVMLPAAWRSKPLEIIQGVRWASQPPWTAWTTATVWGRTTRATKQRWSKFQPQWK